MVRLVRVSPGPRREKCGAWSAKERLADMEVSRNERFKLEVGLAEGRADYRTKIVYQRNDRAVNKKKLKSNRNQISFEYVLFLYLQWVSEGRKHPWRGVDDGEGEH